MSFMDRRAFLGRAALGVLASSSLGVVVPGEAKAAGGTRGPGKLGGLSSPSAGVGASQREPGLSGSPGGLLEVRTLMDVQLLCETDTLCAL